MPMFLHPNPENILVVGGGDGGVVREVLKHKQVKTITMCEIDEVVVNLCKEHFPSMVKRRFFHFSNILA